MPESNDTGARVRDIRKRRGLTQRELSLASGVSLSTIRKLEQGETTATRMETAHRLAVALRVTTSSLLTREASEPGPVPEAWRPLQEAVERPAAQPDDEPTLEGVEAGLAEVRAAHVTARLREEVALLVPLLRDAEALGRDPEARGLHAQALQLAGAVLTQTRQFPAAETALRRALDTAPDRLSACAVVTTQTWLLTRQGRFAEARAMAQRWSDDTEPRLSRAHPEDVAAWGLLLLRGAAASLRDARPGESDDMLRLARAAAVVTGRLPLTPARTSLPWSPQVVAYNACERGVILDRPGEVLAAAERLKGTQRGQRTDYHRHRLDVAKAHTMMRQYGEAVQVLAEVEAESPEWLAQQQYARDILSDVVAKRRTLTPQMRELADTVGLPL